MKVTCKCNLNCIFCHREGSRETRDLLTVEDYRFIAEACYRAGIRKFKITGGEPLTRSDIVDIVRVFAQYGEVSMTTNGTLLQRYLRNLHAAGLSRINISLHTLDRGKYRFITGRDLLDTVVDNIIEASRIGFRQVKINMIVMSINVDEIPKMIEFCREHRLTLQLIELMPIGISSELFSKLHVPLRPILEKLKKSTGKVEIRRDLHNRPIVYIDDVPVEFVMGLNNPEFCKACSQVRLTSDGKLRGCIYRPLEVNVYRFIKQRDAERLINAIFELRRSWTPMWTS